MAVVMQRITADCVFSMQVAVKSLMMTRVPALWWVCCRLVAWWAVSLRAALSFRAAVRQAAPAWLEAVGPAGRAQPCSTMAATSNWAVSSLSSASLSSPVSSPKRSSLLLLPPVAWAPPATAQQPPLPAPPPPTHHHSTLPQWAAPPAGMTLTLRLSLPTKCPYCALTLFHDPQKKSRPPSFCFAPFKSQWRESCTAGWSPGKS